MFSAGDDLFHQPRFGEDQWTETNFYSFSIMEEGLCGYIYMAAKTALEVSAYQVVVYKGWPVHREDFDYFDTQYYAPVSNQNLDDITLNGVFRIRVIDPLQHYRFDYNAGAGCELHLDFHGISPCDPVTPVLDAEEDFNKTFPNKFATLADSGHLEQTMRVTGEMILRGKRYEVDTMTARDHSWSRRADHVDKPWASVVWDNACWADGFGFRVMGRIRKEGNEFSVFAGNIIEEGKSYLIKSAKGYCTRTDRMVKELVYQLTDERGNEYSLRGKAISGWFVTNPNGNVTAVCGFLNWTVNDRADIGHGEFQHAWHVGNSPFK